MQEVWKPTAYDNYEVSNLGKVRAVHRGLGGHPLSEPREHKNIATKKGYVRVMLCLDGHQKNVSLPRLVAEAFIGEQPSPEHVVSYKDGDKTNCSAENLYWATRLEAAYERRKRDYEKYGENSTLGRELARRKHLKEKYDRALEAERLVKEEKLSPREAGKRVGLSESGVYRIVSGAHNTVLKKAHSQD